MDSKRPISKKELMQQDGYVIEKNLFPSELMADSIEDIKINISKFANELGITDSEYLSSTGRWSTSSDLLAFVSQAVDGAIKNHLENEFECRLTQKKSNVICKTADVKDEVPFHQDLSYSANDPYHFSVWLSLNKVEKESGALQIIEDSHKWEVQPLVDFWSPNFKDHYAENRNSYKIKTLEVSPGDAIIFDSRLMHGSDKNLAGLDRFAYVTRWVINDCDFPVIPKAESSSFGILNGHKLTTEILGQYLPVVGYEGDWVKMGLEDIIKTWLTVLADKTVVLPDVDVVNAVRDLKKLLILNQATRLHSAGDISGKIYKNVWTSLLVFLK